jgi:predicted DsbA family dithiol-disulfide isomerase/uncharacterized membrane protein
MAISIYLVIHHYNLIYAMSESKSFCTLNSKIDCDAVNTSQFSEIFGIPVAMIQFFMLLAGLLILAGMRAFSEDEKPRIARFFLYLTSINFLATVVMGVISTLILKTFCLMCASLYIVAIVIWVCAMKLNPKGSYKHKFDDLRGLLKSGSEGGTRGFFILFLLIPVGSALASGMYQKSILSSSDFEKMVERSIDDWKESKLFDLKGTTGAQAGNPSAAFKIVEFYDYQCPHCKRASPSIHAFVNAHRDEVHLDYQNYPLDKSCNPRGGEHEYSCALARGALCALKQNKFTEAHDWIFDHQDTLTADSVNQLAGELGLDKDNYTKCLTDRSTIEELKKEVDLGNSANLEGTPTIFVNGRVLPGGFLIPVLEAALKSL